jgi:TrmH family RNA methyltransferase
LLLLADPLQLPTAWTLDQVYHASSAVLEKLSAHKQNPGFLAEFTMPQQPVLDRTLGGMVLYKVADPGNAGTLIRSAAAFGWRQVLLLGSVDPYASKVVQASVGALAGVALHTCSAETNLGFLDGGAPLAGLVLNGGRDPRQMPAQSRWLVVGSEAHGIEAHDVSRCQELISIPMQTGVESLNAAVAGSIAACCLGMR